MTDDAHRLDQLHAHHPRQWHDFHYVYPVFSRRSGGLSIGVNLNPDKICNWNCIYCQVDRSAPLVKQTVDIPRLSDELEAMLTWVKSGTIWDAPPFDQVPVEQQRVNDIALSGDGEPTTCPDFTLICQLIANLKIKYDRPDILLIVLTNMTMAHRASVQEGLAILQASGGQIWAKLDAGHAEDYHQIDRSSINFQRTIDNLRLIGQRQPLIIQSLFMQQHSQPPTDQHLTRYFDCLRQLIDDGCQIDLVQLYSIARQTAESWVGPLTDEQMDDLADEFRRQLPNTLCDIYYGVHTTDTIVPDAPATD